MAKATPTLKAAGMVMIDTSTPTTAPDLARPRAMIPADPAAKATTNAPEVGPDEQVRHRALPGQVRPRDPAEPSGSQDQQEHGKGGQEEPHHSLGRMTFNRSGATLPPTGTSAGMRPGHGEHRGRIGR
jgi:hypothetical protein